MIKINNLSKNFETADGTVEALKNVSLNVEIGDCIVIGGENGSGKSVLMSIIAGLEEPDEGSVECVGKVGLIFQEAETQILGETPREDIAFGPKNMGLKSAKLNDLVKEALEKTGLKDKADFPARFLSGGEKRRLAVACMLAMKYPVLIFDEPYANLDFSGVKMVNSLIKELQKEGKTIIILTHEIEKCLGLANRFVVLFRGEKVFDGNPAEGVTKNLELWNIKNPLVKYQSVQDLLW
ncbi:MAG: energy-coupling factor ABC transporter ATP-binding protein [Treponema sp.]|nr:energy-coupling factor ABC transporter ATP-binding protein [Treponema sp.]